MDSVPRDVTLPSLDRLSAVTTSSTLDRETQEPAIRANQTHREASQQISAYQQQMRGIESSTPIEKFNEEEMVQSLKSQLEHALVKRPETYSMEDSREQLMARLNDVTTFAEQESKRAECLLCEKGEIVKQYESDVLQKDQMIAIEGGHRQDAILELAQSEKQNKKSGARWTRSRRRPSTGD